MECARYLLFFDVKNNGCAKNLSSLFGINVFSIRYILEKKQIIKYYFDNHSLKAYQTNPEISVCTLGI